MSTIIITGFRGTVSVDRRGRGSRFKRNLKSNVASAARENGPRYHNIARQQYIIIIDRRFHNKSYV